MIAQTHYRQYTPFVLIYQNHMLVPFPASIMNFELGEDTIYPLNDNMMGAPLVHQQLVCRTLALTREQVAASPTSPEFGNLLKEWGEHRTNSVVNKTSWVALSKKEQTLRLYTPDEASVLVHPFEANGVKMTNEFLEVKLPGKGHDPFVVSPRPVVISDDFISILRSEILNPVEIAKRLIPKISQDYGIYTAIRLPVYQERLTMV